MRGASARRRRGSRTSRRRRRRCRRDSLFFSTASRALNRSERRSLGGEESSIREYPRRAGAKGLGEGGDEREESERERGEKLVNASEMVY